MGEDRKLATHLSDCTAVGVSFSPLVVETLGGWNQLDIEVISRIGQLLALHSGSESVRHLF